MFQITAKNVRIRTVLVLAAIVTMASADSPPGLCRGETPTLRNPQDALAEPTEIFADKEPLADVLRRLSKRHSVAIYFDKNSVPEAAVGELTVNCQLSDIPLGVALRALLAGFDLDVVARNGAIVVIPKAPSTPLDRVPTASAKLANEAKIAATLLEKTAIDFADQPLIDVLEYIETRHGIAIELDERALTDAGVSTDVPITRSIKGITLESVLDLLLSNLDLTWVIHNEVLLITSESQAKEIIETRVYPIYDLVAPLPGELPSVDGPDYQALIDALADAAALPDGTPDPRSIRIYRPAGALIITRPVVVHRRIEKLLNMLRQARAAQSAPRQ